MTRNDRSTGGRDAESRVVLTLVLDHYVGVAEGMESLRLLTTTPGVVLVVWSALTTIAPDLRDRFAMAVGGCSFAEELPNSPETLRDYQGVYVPIASNGLVYALSEGDDRDPVVRTLLLATFLGIPAAILGMGWDPNTDSWVKAGLGRASTVWPDAWRMRSQRLRHLGMDVLRTPDMVTSWAGQALEGPRVLDAALVEVRHHQGQREVSVGTRTIVTPGAHDRLRQYGMTLRTSGEKTWRLDE